MRKTLALILCVMLTSMTLAGTASRAETAGAAEAPRFYSHGGRVTLIDGACTETPIVSFEDAAGVVNSVLTQLGGDGRTSLEPWRDVADAFGNRYFVFQQMYDNTTVLGGAVKVMTDGSGRMLGLTSSIVSELPETREAEGVTAAEAEQIVLDQARKTRQQELTLQEGLTARMILPKTLKIDLEEEDTEGSRYVWVVYTSNPDSSRQRASELPYLAHYVTLAGEYLYSLPAIMPGDEASTSGFDAGYVFEFMEPAEYTGYVDLSTGGETEISVTVMRDRRTGMYYLGNLERRIVVGDCWEFLYNGGKVVLESSPDNLEWDQTGLKTFYNYCRAYDYYREIGWIGGDGLGTPILVLNNFCDINRKPVDNAAYVGNYLGWQLFLASQANDLSQCLDVLAHEYTHCVTGSLMTYNAYENDYGAINEAISDIQGNTCQRLMEGEEATPWELGDRSLTGVRSMSEPHRFQQPEFTWDIYYTPNALTPTALNDQGGVHTNSSLLNYLAWRLYEKGGMTMEEGRAFWFTVDCAMVPGTDYPQLAELLPWALKATGLGKYEAELRRSLDATRLGVDTVPGFFDDDRALLTLRLPDNAIFDDGQWIMELLTVDIDRMVETAHNLIAQAAAGDYSMLPASVRAMLEAAQAEEAKIEEEAEAEKKAAVETEAGAAETEEAEEKQSGAEEKGLIESLLDALLEMDEAGIFTEEAAVSEETASENAAQEEVPPEITAPEKDETPESDGTESEIIEWARGLFGEAFYLATTHAGQDGRTIRIVSRPGIALPILIHGVYNESADTLENVYALAYIGNRWIDLSAMFREPAEGGEVEIGEDLEAVIDYWVENIFSIRSYSDVLDLVFYRLQGGRNNNLPAAGLESAAPVSIDLEAIEESTDVQPRKSRPKTEREGASEEDRIPEGTGGPETDAAKEAEISGLPDTVRQEEAAPEPAEEPIRQSGYVFRPGVCSAYMEEVFGKTMCETWLHLVDAVMAGEHTFACPDQDTYDWVMGQFPVRCFPVLTELIDFAYDRENSVADGIASFTYLVPREEAARRIGEFAQQVEDILNEVLEDDYSEL